MASVDDGWRAASLADRVCACRRALGLSQEAFAKRLGVSFATVNRWERGRTIPAGEPLRRFESIEGALRRGTASASAGAALRNWPGYLSRFVGREAESTGLLEILRTARLVSVTGPGGCGKTRLVVESGAALASTFAGGAVFVPLDALSDGSEVTGAVARAAGAAPEAAAEASAIAALRGAPRVLVLDNCEHLVAGAAATAAMLLEECPQLSIVVTGRQPLGIEGERVMLLEPFGARDEAVRLFEDRAAARGYAEHPADREAIRQLCERLDGLPLAVELAAAHAPAIAPREILRRIDDRFRLLVSHDVSRPARHRGLYAALAWSFELLDPGERTLFAALGVFPGAFSLETAELVAAPDGGDGRADVLLMISALVSKSMLRVVESPTGVRYAMLESIREYARERLDNEPVLKDEVWGRLVEWGVALAALAEARMGGPQQPKWLARMDADWPSLRAALHAAIERRDSRGAVALAGSLMPYLYSRSMVSEGLDFTRRVLDIRGETPLAQRAKVVAGAGTLARLKGDFELAARYLEQNLAMQRELGDERGVARAYNSLAGALHGAGRAAEARDMQREGLESWRRLSDSRGIASALSNLGVISCDEGDYARAREYGEEALALRLAFGQAESIAISYENLATCALRSGRTEDARNLYGITLRRYQALDEMDGVATCLEGFAALAARTDAARGISLYGAAEALRERIGVPATPADREFHAAVIRALREAEPAFGSFWRDGGLLSLDAAVARALETPESEPGLSQREAEVYRLLCTGASNKQIARSLGLTARTVDGYVSRIYRKLGVGNRTEAVIASFRPKRGERTQAVFDT